MPKDVQNKESLVNSEDTTEDINYIIEWGTPSKYKEDNTSKKKNVDWDNNGWGNNNAISGWGNVNLNSDWGQKK